MMFHSFHYQLYIVSRLVALLCVSVCISEMFVTFNARLFVVFLYFFICVSSAFAFIVCFGLVFVCCCEFRCGFFDFQFETNIFQQKVSSVVRLVLRTRQCGSRKFLAFYIYIFCVVWFPIRQKKNTDRVQSTFSFGFGISQDEDGEKSTHIIIIVTLSK